MKQFIKSLLLIILLSSKISYSQQSHFFKISKIIFDSTLVNRNSNKIPRFDGHLGAGKVNGLRIGSRILFNRSVSFETSVGIPVSIGLKNIVGFQSDLPIISLGINGHLLDKNITISLITTFLKEYNKNFQLSYISPNIGFIELEKSGIHFFIRIGPYFEVNSFRFGRDIGLNIDFGFNNVFD